MQIGSTSLSHAVARQFASTDRSGSCAQAPCGPAGDSYAPHTPGSDSLSLFQRLAESARKSAATSPGPSLTMDPAAVSQGLTDTLQGIFGIRIASISFSMDLTHAHEEQGQASIASATDDRGGSALAYQAGYRSVDATHLAAEGELVTADGQTLRFSLDYQRRVERSIDLSGQVLQGPPPPSEGIRPPLPGAEDRGDSASTLLLKRLRKLIQDAAPDQTAGRLGLLWPAGTPEAGTPGSMIDTRA
jgi:hypothetical protein